MPKFFGGLFGNIHKEGWNFNHIPSKLYLHSFQKAIWNPSKSFAQKRRRRYNLTDINKEVAIGPRARESMKQLLIKPEKCIGCRTCELVCSFGHYGQFNPKMANVKVFEYEKAAVAIPMMCLQCEDPSCLKVCPVKALSRDENGAVVMNYDKCIGCKMCMNVCPLGNISFHPALKRVFKCDLCGGDPKCAKYCPSGAIEFAEADALSERRRMVSDCYKDLIGEEEQA